MCSLRVSVDSDADLKMVAVYSFETSTCHSFTCWNRPLSTPVTDLISTACLTGASVAMSSAAGCPHLCSSHCTTLLRTCAPLPSSGTPPTSSRLMLEWPQLETNVMSVCSVGTVGCPLSTEYREAPDDPALTLRLQLSDECLHHFYIQFNLEAILAWGTRYRSG